MKRFYSKISIFLWIVMLTLSACANALPNLSFDLGNGKTITLDELQGKSVIINFFASWCKPCYLEIPAFNKLARQYPNDLVIFGVNFNEEEANREAKDKLKIQFAILENNPAPDLGIDSISVLPTTIIIDKDHRNFKIVYGLQTHSSLLRALNLP